jgi:hypothetical protein
MNLLLSPALRRYLGIACLLVLGVLFVAGVGADMLRPLGMGRLQSGCRDYLDRSQSRAFTTFLTLSVIKGGLGVLEGSTASLSLLGTGVEVEVGDMAQSAYDTVDFAWRVMLVSYVALFLAEVLVVLGEVAGGFLLGVACLVGAVYAFGRMRRRRGRWMRLCGRALSVLLVLSIALYLLLPVSLLVGSTLSDGIVEPIRRENQQALEELERTVDVFQGDITRWPGRAKELIVGIGGLLESVVEGLLRLSVAYIVDVIVVPLGLVIALYLLTRGFLRNLVGGSDAERLERAVRRSMKSVMRGSGPSGGR